MHHPEDHGELKKLLDQVLTTSEFAWWEWDIKANQVVTNDLKATMLGYDPEDFQGAGYQAYTDLLHPDDYERTMQAMRDHLEGRAPLYQIDYRIKRADGTYTWYMDRGAILQYDPQGAPLLLRGIVVDLGPTLHAQSEDQAVRYMLRESLPDYQQGREMVTLCSGCKRLKTREQTWLELTPAFALAFNDSISHGLCPDCICRLYPVEAKHLGLGCDNKKKE